MRRRRRSRPRQRSYSPASQPALESRFRGGLRSHVAARRRRPPRRPERQQIMLRRALALGGGLLVLILIVLGVKGCLDAAQAPGAERLRRATSPRSSKRPNQTSKGFFGKLDEPGRPLGHRVRRRGQRRPQRDGQLRRAGSTASTRRATWATRRSTLELVYELRGSAMNEIAEQMSTALGDVGAEKATAAIAKQMQKLLAARRPLRDGRAAGNRRRPRRQRDRRRRRAGERLPAGRNQWLDESTVSSALGSVSGASGAETSGRARARPARHQRQRHRTGRRSDHRGRPREETPEVEVEVQNQGESTENGVTVSVTVEGGTTVDRTISSIGAGEIQTVDDPADPGAERRSRRSKSKSQPVPGEQVTENNEATYTVEFE